MPTITIPASDVRTGDVINIGGMPRPVRLGDPNHTDTSIVYVEKPFSAIHFPADQALTVDRPDPDEALVEAMAKSIHEQPPVYDLPWDELSETSRDHNLRVARMYLDAYRKHTESTMQAALDDHRKNTEAVVL